MKSIFDKLQKAQADQSWKKNEFLTPYVAGISLFHTIFLMETIWQKKMFLHPFGKTKCQSHL